MNYGTYRFLILWTEKVVRRGISGLLKLLLALFFFRAELRPWKQRKSSLCDFSGQVLLGKDLKMFRHF